LVLSVVSVEFEGAGVFVVELVVLLGLVLELLVEVDEFWVLLLDGVLMELVSLLVLLSLVRERVPVLEHPATRASSVAAARSDRPYTFLVIFIFLVPGSAKAGQRVLIVALVSRVVAGRPWSSLWKRGAGVKSRSSVGNVRSENDGQNPVGVSGRMPTENAPGCRPPIPIAARNNLAGRERGDPDLGRVSAPWAKGLR
jgi:hypothetical protein